MPELDLPPVPRAHPDLLPTFLAVLDEHRAMPQGRPGPEVDLDRGLWDALDGAGLTRLSGTLPDGTVRTWADAALLLAAAGAHATPVPFVEHDLLGRWLLQEAGLPLGPGLRTACRPDAAGVAINVTWARDADTVVALFEDGDDWRVAEVPMDRVVVDERRNLAGEPSDTVEFDLADLEVGPIVDPSIGDRFHVRGALARSIQVVGAMSRVVEIVLENVTERNRLGRPIGGFQAVQHLVADLVAETELARSATEVAVARAASSNWQDPGMLFAVCVAKSCVGHAASVVVRHAHQVVGAAGTTLGHELPPLTRQILTRRSEFGSVREWDETLTELATGAGRDRLWRLMTTGRASSRY